MKANPLLVALVTLLVCAASSVAAERPNIMVFRVDDMGVMDTSDPFESTNLARSRPEELRWMTEGMIDSLKKHDAVYPVDDGGRELRPRLP